MKVPQRGFRTTFDAVRPRLKLVESFIAERVNQGPPPVQEAASYVLEAGGKRLRPALLLVAARALGYRGDQDIRYAAIVELVHTATLVHDDIIDHAPVRRGRATANHRWGNQFTVLLGDWLYLKAIDLAVEVDDVEAMRILSSTTTKMTEGEILGLLLQGRISVTREEYMEVTRRKTAELFAAAASLPSCFSPELAAHRAALDRYGRNLGICFQIVDDLLDITGSQETLGKPVFSDLREGKITLPFILFLAQANARERAAVERVLKSGELSDPQSAELRAMLDTRGVLASIEETARSYGRAAADALAELPPSPERNALALAPSFVIDREQ